jgi:excisionase family DNA binding protein
MENIQNHNSVFNPGKGFLSPKELAVYLSISIPTIYRLIEKRQLPFNKIGGSLRFKKEDVDKYLEESRINPIKF